MLTKNRVVRYGSAMKRCVACQKEITTDRWIGRQQQCVFCGADLHVCRNCFFYEPGVYNDCREPQSERVVDKNRANFCDYFRFKDTTERNKTPSANSKDQLDALFKK